MGLGAITGVRGVIGRLNQYMQQYTPTWLDRLAMVVPSDQSYEQYGWLGSSPSMREWIGSRIEKGLRENAMRIENKPYEATLGVFEEDLRRDKTGQLDIRIREMAQKAAVHPYILLSNLINAGGGSTNGLAYDGQFFFDTDHSEGSSGAQKNDLTAADYTTLDVATPTAPTVDEMTKAIFSVIQHFQAFKDDQGEPYNELANEFIVMVPFGLSGAAMQAVAANVVTASGGQTRDNVLTKMDFSLEVLTNPRMTNQSQFCVFRTDGVTKPFIIQEELGVTMEVIGAGSEEVFRNRKYLFGLKAFRGAGYAMWQHAIRATLS